MSSQFLHRLHIVLAVNGVFAFLCSLIVVDGWVVLALALFYILLSICAGTARDRAAQREREQRRSQQFYPGMSLVNPRKAKRRF